MIAKTKSTVLIVLMLITGTAQGGAADLPVKAPSFPEAPSPFFIVR
jgi:hypothetical protein